MSSHHIVREKQEPALLILGLNTFPDELLGQLLEWGPTVITTSQTAEQVNAFGIKIDWLVTADPPDDLQSDIKLMPAGTDSLAEAALKHLVVHNYPAVNIVTDELHLKDYLFYTGKLDLVIFCDNRKIFPVSSGFSKWKPGGEVIELLSAADNLAYSGLESLGDHCFKTTRDGFFSLQFDQPFVFVAEEI